MSVRVLVVDDSRFFRRRVCEILEADPHITVVATAVDGHDALEKLAQFKPDVITMDIEMPVMDGITAVRRIMSIRPTPVLMFSSLTREGARATLDALEAGAVDFLPKRFEDIARDSEQAKRLLRARVREIGARGFAGGGAARPSPPIVHAPSETPCVAIERGKAAGPVRLSDFDVVVIGTSTGGPVALQQVLNRLPASFALPLLLVQHMPGSFTPTFAGRLDQICAITVREAADGDVLAPGTALLAPGGRQMTVEQHAGRARVCVFDGDPDLHYRPSVDVTFISAARAFPGRVLAIVMTGMGADGRHGAEALKRSGSTVWAQDEKSCVIYGMPQAVVQAGLADCVLPLSEIGAHLAGES